MSVYCFHCFTKIENPNITFCPECGKKYNVHYAQSNELPAGTRLNNGRYFVGTAIGSGGFGISYAGYDTRLRRKVLIKETFYAGVFKRNTLNKENPNPLEVTYGIDISLEEIMRKTEKECVSLSEAENLENVVKVYDWFSENNTAYIITEFIEGVTLYDHVQQNGYYSWNELKPLIVPLMYSLSALHQKNIIHRDIKPQNIMIKRSSHNRNRFILIDFGLARSDSTKTLASVGSGFSPGYSPMEQRTFLKRDNTYTDIYALAATIYFSLTKHAPNEEMCQTVDENFPLLSVLHSEYGVPENVTKVLRGALAPDYHRRINSVDILIAAFEDKADSNNSNAGYFSSAEANNTVNPTYNSIRQTYNSMPYTGNSVQPTYNSIPKSGSSVHTTNNSSLNTSVTNHDSSANQNNTKNETDYVDVNKKKKSTISTTIIAAASVCLIITAALFWGLSGKNDSGKSESSSNNNTISSLVSSITVSTNSTVDDIPSFVGKSVDEAKNYLTNNNISFSIEEVYNESISKNNIVSQELNNPSFVELKVSKGKKPAESKSSSSSQSSSSKKSESSKKSQSSKESKSSKKFESSKMSENSSLTDINTVSENNNNASSEQTSTKTDNTTTQTENENYHYYENPNPPPENMVTPPADGSIPENTPASSPEPESTSNPEPESTPNPEPENNSNTESQPILKEGDTLNVHCKVRDIKALSYLGSTICFSSDVLEYVDYEKIYNKSFAPLICHQVFGGNIWIVYGDANTIINSAHDISDEEFVTLTFKLKKDVYDPSEYDFSAFVSGMGCEELIGDDDIGNHFYLDY